MYATSRGEVEIMKLLLEYHADVTLKDLVILLLLIDFILDGRVIKMPSIMLGQVEIRSNLFQFSLMFG